MRCLRAEPGAAGVPSACLPPAGCLRCGAAASPAVPLGKGGALGWWNEGVGAAAGRAVPGCGGAGGQVAKPAAGTGGGAAAVYCSTPTDNVTLTRQERGGGGKERKRREGGMEGAGGSRARGGNSLAGWCAASRDRLSWEFPRREGEGERRSPPPAGRGRSFALRSPASFPPSLLRSPPARPAHLSPRRLTHTHRHTEARAGGAHHPAAGRCRSRPARFPAGARGEPGDVTGGALAPRSPPRNFWFWEVVPGIAPADPPAAPGAPARPPSFPPSLPPPPGRAAAPGPPPLPRATPAPPPLSG